MPVAPAVVMATAVAPPTAPGQIGGGGLASGSSAVGFAPAVSDGLGLSNVATHSVAPDSKYGIGTSIYLCSSFDLAAHTVNVSTPE